MIKLNVCMSFCGMNGNDGSACVYQDDDDDVYLVGIVLQCACA